jgi:C-terminal processing protease CtpA/Prc/Flp pilus assembly protein TadD
MKKATLARTVFVVLVFTWPLHDARAQELSAPEKNFEYLWQTYDRNYALFRPKHIDWSALYKVYRTRVTAKTTDAELFDMISSLLGNLNDNHVRLNSPDRSFQSGILGEIKQDSFSLDLIKASLLKNPAKELMNGVFVYGWLTDSIGYFHFNRFSQMEQSAAAIDEIIKEFKDAKAIVVDVRANGGGDDRVGKLIADRFADRKRLYMKTQIRNGPSHDDFTPPKYWYVEPDGPIQFTRPVILLTHRFSVSAAENFTLAMRILPNVTVVGDATSGVFADVYGDRMPNGWRFSVPFKLFVDQDGFCWEGIGVPADIRQTNTKKDLDEKRDKPLELAVALIQAGALRPKVETSSLRDIRESLAWNLYRSITQKGLADAIAEFNRAKSGNPNSYYLDQEELLDAGNKLWDAGKHKEAIEVFKINVREFPGSYVAYERLGKAYASTGDDVLAREQYQKALELNRRSYPWEIQSYTELSKLAAGTRLLARDLERNINDKGIDAAVKAFDQARLGPPSSYYIDESQMNQLGYQFLRGGKTKEAIAVFELNVREFPGSFNAYDSLGEAHMAAGNRDLAIKDYKKSIELNPQNANGADMLKRLEAGPAPADPQAYDAYAGSYDSPMGLIEVTRHGDKLFAQPAGASKEELTPETDGVFKVAAVGARFTFVKDESGRVTQAVIRVGDQEIKAKKVR